MLLAVLSSCQRIEISTPINGRDVCETETEFVTKEGQTVLGDVIDIPYSIDNLLVAYENLPIETKSQINLSDIQPTHYYIRFYPKSIAELDILRNIKPYVFLSETPLDRKIEVGGTSYHDPSIPEDLPTYQYTVVPVQRWAELEKTVPVESEILIKAYMPDYDEAYTTKSEEKYGLPPSAYEALMREAYRITGNEYDIIPETKASWTPAGRIRAYDDKTSSYLPVPGVRVRGSHLLNVQETLTNSNGVYVLPSFNNSVSYKIIWESDEWDIRDGLTGQAKFDGPTQNNGWSPDIGTMHEKTVRYAATQRAAYRWYYGSIEGLLRPNMSSKLKICQRVEPKSHRGVFTDVGLMGWHIETWIRDANGNYRTIHDSFESTAHEIGHAAHYSRVDSYNSYCESMKESWATFVEGIVSHEEYGEYPDNYTTVHDSWPNITFPKYTPIFIDLYDSVNQNLLNYSTPFDAVSGFSALQLNQILLNGSTDLDNLRENLSPLPDGVTELQLDFLFVDYANHWVADD